VGARFRLAQAGSVGTGVGIIMVGAVGAGLGVSGEVEGAQEIKVRGMMNMKNKNDLGIDFINTFPI
jgi:hypothetical protein